MKIKVVLIISSLGFLLSCDRETIQKELIGPDFHPLDTSKYIVYNRTDINHDAFLNESDTISYLQREIITQQLTDSTGTKYIGKIENSFDNGITWEFHQNISFSKDQYSIQRVQSDIRKVKLSFPLLERKSWDVNAFNTQDFQRARVRDLNEQYVLEDTVFSESVFIDLGNTVDLFFTNIEFEVYAKDIGLIAHHYKDLEQQPDKYLQGTEYVKVFKDTNW